MTFGIDDNATFLIQVLSAEKTLRAAVASLLTQLAAAGKSVLPSGDATAYYQARRRCSILLKFPPPKSAHCIATVGRRN